MATLSSTSLFKKYPVRCGTINFGVPYESVTAAILSVHHCRKNEMWLSRNLESIGNFDDIVLKSDRFTYLIQVKYNNRNEIITRSIFTTYKEKEQFCLENCLGDYWKLKSKIDKVSQDNDVYKYLHNDEDNLKYILHTNRAVANCDFLEIVDSKFYYNNNLNHGKLYRFKTKELLNYPNLKNKFRVEFFDNLYLYSEEMLFRNTDNATMLSTELKELLKEAGCKTMCSNDKKLLESAIFYKHFFEQWEMCLLNDTSTHNYPLVRDHIIAKVTEILLDKFSFEFKNINPGNLPRDSSWNTLKDANIIVTDSDTRIYPLLKKYIKNRINPNSISKAVSDRCKIYHKTGNSDHSRWCMWMHKLVPLVLEIQEYQDFADIVRYMQLLNCSLSILIINSTRKDWQFLEKTITNCKTPVRYLTSSELLSQNRSCYVENTDVATNVSASSIHPGPSNANEIENINLQQIIDNNGISIGNVNITDKFGKTALHYAAWTKSTKKVRAFLHMGADANAKDLTGKTPLHCAVDANDIDCITCLLIEGAKIDEVDHEDSTPLLYAVKNGQTEIVDLLLLNNANTNIPDALGRTALYISVSRNKQDIVTLLLHKKASTDLQYNGDTILHIAITSSSIDIVALLIENGTKIDMENAFGKTALYTAVDLNKINVVDLLLNKDARTDIKCQGNTALHRAVIKNSTEIVQRLLEKIANVNQLDSVGRTALYLAVDNDSKEIVSLLLNNNANTEEKFEGNTVLHHAVTKGFIQTIDLLLTNGAKINAQNSRRKTALHLACDSWPNGKKCSRKIDSVATLAHAKTFELIVKLLLDKGAKIKIKDCFNKTALYYAENMKSNIGKYLDDGSMDYTDEEAENYFLLRPLIIECYENIASLMEDKCLEIEENDGGSCESREE